KCPHSKDGRNLVVCIDGTSNQFGVKNTNVIELYHLVKKLPGDNQVTYYNSGIGTYAKPSWKSLHYWSQVFDHTIDLAIAWNFDQIVLDAYRWLSEKYRKGDRIFLFGFSRGAYQVRTLAAMINKVRLIHSRNGEQIPLYVRSSYCPPKNDRTFASAHFKEVFSHEARVHFVGAWDTVSSVGVVRSKVLPGTADGMRHVCFFHHALAFDERRVKFLPEYVNQGLLPKRSESSQLRPPCVKEVWFAGTHSDMAPPLRWMIYEAIVAGLKLDDWTTATQTQTEVHESLKGIWWLLELLPMKYLSYKTKDGTRRRPHLGASRQVKGGQMIHSTVMDALQQMKYTPKAIPASKLKHDWEKLRTESPMSQDLPMDIEKDLFGLVQLDLERSMDKYASLGGEASSGNSSLSDLDRWVEISEHLGLILC
ncbi:hypothetical protein OBBRIDRAFT_738162, partial [Obba rivulosa]